MPFIAVPLLILMIWPFHHKAAPQPSKPAVPIMEGEPTIPERLCTHDPVLGWEFLGPDGTAGVSTLSCQDAFRHWNATPTSKAVWNRT